MLHSLKSEWKRKSEQCPEEDGSATTGYTQNSTTSPPEYYMDTSIISATDTSENVTKTRDRSRSADLIKELTQPPLKKRKREHFRSENLGEAMSKTNGVKTDYRRSPTPQIYLEPQAQRRQEFLEIAKRRNTIHLLDSSATKMLLAAEMIRWAFTQQPLQLESNQSHNYVIFVMRDVDDPNTMGEVLTTNSGRNFSCSPKTAPSSNRVWQEYNSRDLIVTTAQTLLNWLLRDLLTISQIDCLVFDHDDDPEGDRPSLRIVSEFYAVAPTADRPRVLSLVYPPRLLDSFLRDLRTAENASFCVHCGPQDLVHFYEPNPPLRVTRVFRQLQHHDYDSGLLTEPFAVAKDLLCELGPCAADSVWKRYLQDFRTTFHLPQIGIVEDSDSQLPGDNVLAKDAHAKALIGTILRELEVPQPVIDPDNSSFNVAQKFLQLVRVLKCFRSEQRANTFRGIIFVRKPATALLMEELLRKGCANELPLLRPAALVRPRKHTTWLNGSSMPEVLQDFDCGTVNLIIAVQMVDDHLDIPRCTCVILYNLCQTPALFAHLRARASLEGSNVVVLAEKGNGQHKRSVRNITGLKSDEYLWCQAVLFCGNESSLLSPPPSALLESLEDDDESDVDDDGDYYIQDPTTSSRIYPKHAYHVVHRFVALAKSRGMVSISLEWFVAELDEPSGGYLCDVQIRGLFDYASRLLTDQPSPRNLTCETRHDAVDLAFFCTCEKLFCEGLLDTALFPQPKLTHRLPGSPADSDDDDDANAANSPNKLPKPTPIGTRIYPRKLPYFWSNSLRGVRSHAKNDVTDNSQVLQRLFPTMIFLGQTKAACPGYQPLCILTRTPLPAFSPFRVFFSGVPADVSFRCGAPFEVDRARLTQLGQYTMRICRSLANKPFECEIEDMGFFLAPLNDSAHMDDIVWPLPRPYDWIPWDDVSLACSHWAISLKFSSTDALEKDIEDAIIQDRWVEFTRRYDTPIVRHDLSPLSRPEGVRESTYENHIEYCRARRKGFEGLQNDHQPLIEVSRIPALLNRLNPASRPWGKEHLPRFLKDLIPELCAKFTVPSSIMRTSTLLPSVLRRLDDLLLVKELNAKIFGNWIDESHLHAAITAPSASAEFDYERLELLGDAYLKYLSSVYLFVKQPRLHEGALHIARQNVVSNRNLLRRVGGSEVPHYVQSKPLAVKTWLPFNFVIAQLGAKEASTQQPNDDCSRPQLAAEGAVEAVNQDTKMLEAVPSAELPSATHGVTSQVDTDSGYPPSTTINLDANDTIASATRSVAKPFSAQAKRLAESNAQHLGDKCVADVVEAIIGAAYVTGGADGLDVALQAAKRLGLPFSEIDRWSDFGREFLAAGPEPAHPLKVEALQDIHRIIGHPIKAPYLAQALTHTSLTSSEIPCYERLEFMGDAILDFLVVRHIYDRYGRLSPGALTLLKSAMVSNSTLAALCVEHGLQKYLLYNSAALSNNIRDYLQALELAKAKEYEQAKLEERTPGQYWLDIDPPKALSDIVESIIGAVFVSDNCQHSGIEIVYQKLLQPFYERHISLKTLSHHPTKILFELFQSHGCTQFEILKEGEGNGSMKCEVICHGVIIASTVDTTSQLASRRCSFLALDALEQDPGFMARQCDCRAQMESKKTLKKIAKQAFQFHGAEALSTPRAQLPEENEMDEEREVMETIGEEDEFSS